MINFKRIYYFIKMFQKIKNYLINQSTNHSLETFVISLLLTLFVFWGFKNFKVDDDLVKTFPELEVFYDDCFMATMEGKTLCMLPWVHMYVGADGNVLPCCIGDYKQPLGNTHKNNIKEIWNSQKNYWNQRYDS